MLKNEKAYEIIIPKRVERQMDRLPKRIRQKAVDTMIAFKSNPRPLRCKKLVGFKNLWRVYLFRTYRIYYEIDDRRKRVTLLAITTKEGSPF